MKIPRIPAPAYAPEKLEPNTEVTFHQRQLAASAASRISAAFEWMATDEGHEFWSGVDQRLRQISKNGILRS